MCPWQTQGWDFKWGINENALLFLLVVPLTQFPWKQVWKGCLEKARRDLCLAAFPSGLPAEPPQLSGFYRGFCYCHLRLEYEWWLLVDSLSRESWGSQPRSCCLLLRCLQAELLCFHGPSAGAQAHLNPRDAALLQMSPLLETSIPLLFSFWNMVVVWSEYTGWAGSGGRGKTLLLIQCLS